MKSVLESFDRVVQILQKLKSVGESFGQIVQFSPKNCIVQYLVFIFRFQDVVTLGQWCFTFFATCLLFGDVFTICADYHVIHLVRCCIAFITILYVPKPTFFKDMQV